MTVTGVGSSGSMSAASASLGEISEQKDMFLQLLVAQLRNQDPSSPMDQKDMMAQMTQFTSVEQLANMVKSMETLTFNSAFSQNVGLIGKTVEYATTDADGVASFATSVVQSVGAGNGEIRLNLEDGRTINPGAVVRVS